MFSLAEKGEILCNPRQCHATYAPVVGANLDRRMLVYWFVAA
jgi:hypothetical protein